MNKELIDRAWACLPKEFKAGVKEIYFNAIMYHPCGYNHKTDLLKYLFGNHNLTSYAKGEELLTCEKYKVVEALNYCDELDSISGSHNMLNWGKQIIACLFGSKCLLDEDAHEDNFASIEPKPAETKNEVVKMKPIKSHVSVYLATKEEDEEFRMLLYENGFTWISGTALISLSNWDSANEASHIHFVYHNKTVAYLGKRTKETLTFTEFKKRYFGEDVNLSQETVNCDKQFDNILKDGFHDHNRLHIASIIMSGLLASGKEKHPVRRAMDLADALIAEAAKGESK